MTCPYQLPETLTDIAARVSARFDAERDAAGGFSSRDAEEVHYREINAAQDATVQALVCPTCSTDRSGAWCRMTA
jgi:hypothetical protein